MTWVPAARQSASLASIKPYGERAICFGACAHQEDTSARPAQGLGAQGAGELQERGWAEPSWAGRVQDTPGESLESGSTGKGAQETPAWRCLCRLVAAMIRRCKRS